MAISKMHSLQCFWRDAHSPQKIEWSYDDLISLFGKKTLVCVYVCILPVQTPQQAKKNVNVNILKPELEKLDTAVSLHFHVQ